MKRFKKERISMIINAFRAHIGRPFTLDELATWALDNELYPVPGRQHPPEEVDAWEEQFKRVTAEAVQC